MTPRRHDDVHEDEAPRFYGKYRGTVALNLDPLQLGRLQVSCPTVLGEGRLSWAMPSLPFAGPGVGLFLLPPTGADVWVEFEGGHPDWPIWTGCFWTKPTDVPASPAVPQMKVLTTDGVSLTVNDLPGAGGVTLEVKPPVVATPLTVSLTSTGIELSNGAASVTLSAVSVSLNNGALEVL